MLRAIKRGDKDVLRRMGDVDVPDGVESIPFIRGDAKPVAEPEGAAPLPPPSAAPPAGIPPALVLGLPLPDLVREAAERGVDPYSALKDAGVVGGPLWDRIVEA